MHKFAILGTAPGGFCVDHLYPSGERMGSWCKPEATPTEPCYFAFTSALSVGVNTFSGEMLTVGYALQLPSSRCLHERSGNRIPVACGACITHRQPDLSPYPRRHNHKYMPADDQGSRTAASASPDVRHRSYCRARVGRPDSWWIRLEKTGKDWIRIFRLTNQRPMRFSEVGEVIEGFFFFVLVVLLIRWVFQRWQK
jgi:hypothetical protein